MKRKARDPIVVVLILAGALALLLLLSLASSILRPQMATLPKPSKPWAPPGWVPPTAPPPSSAK